MSRLSDLYKAMETLRKEGLPVDENLEKNANELEEDIIKKEILPVLSKIIEPALQPVKRELVLVVDYIPGQPLSVHLSRKRNFATEIDAKEILPDPEVEHKEIGKTGNKIVKQPVTRLRITFDDGSVIQERNAAESFVSFVRRVGAERVRSLGIKQCKIPLVSNTIDKKYGSKQKPLGNGWFLMTNTSTQSKKHDIELIAESFNIKLKVEII